MAKPSVKQKNNKSNIIVRAINKFSNLHAPAKVLVLALVIGGFGGGSYAVYMSSAAGWTYMGQHTFYNSYTRSSVTFNVYSCKSASTKLGYRSKSMARIMSISGNPASNKYSLNNTISSTKNNTIYDNWAYLTGVPKLNQTFTTAYQGYGGSVDAVYARIYDESLNTYSKSFNKYIRDLSTCP